MAFNLWDAGAMRPGGLSRRAAALAIDGALLGWFVAWLLLPLPWLPAWTVLAITGAYAVAGEGARGRTLGKKALGLYVLEATSGGPAGYRRAAARWAVRVAPAALALLAWSLAPGAFAGAVVLLAAGATLADHLWALRHPLGRSLHDLAAGTVVLGVARAKLFGLSPDHPWRRERDHDQG